MQNSKELLLSSITESDVRRFWLYVDIQVEEDRCWLWTGGLNENGYGSFRLGQTHVKAHKFSSVIASRTDWPAGIVSRHSCDNKPCVRPDHILRGTQLQNVQDSFDRGKRIRYSVVSWAEGPVLRMIALGYKDREVKDTLGIGLTTLHRIKAKNGITNSELGGWSGSRRKCAT